MSEHNERPGYEVGYGKPPKKSQFKPGTSGNPKGRKRKPKSVRSQMETALKKKVTITEGGETKRLTLQEIMLRSIAGKAAKGEPRFVKLVMEILNSPKHDETDVLETEALSPEDQKLLEQFMISSAHKHDLPGTGGPEDPMEDGTIEIAQVSDTPVLETPTKQNEEQDDAE